jgi:hypothetical protein
MEIAIITSLLAKWNMKINACQMVAFFGKRNFLFLEEVEIFNKDNIFHFLLFLVDPIFK